MPEFLAKIQFYLLYGVRLVWVIDPSTERITVQAPGVEPVVLGAGDMLDGGNVLPGFTIDAEEIFARARR
jgi:Uma2 family endonuclease